MISYPIFINIPASTAKGISATNPENLYNKSTRTKGVTTAASLVDAPVFNAATVLIVAAEPGKEPVRAQNILPKP